MDIFYAILVLLVVTRACGELAVRVRQPALVGELIAGIGLGIVVANNAETFPILSHVGENEAFNAIVNLGIFFLMLLAGLELEPRKFAEASARAITVAVSGFLVPLSLGFGLGWLFLPESTLKVAQCLFLGTTLAITAVPVTVKVLMDLGKLGSPAGQMIVSAAVLDDVLSLVLLAILIAVVRTGAFPDANELAFLVLKIATFFAITVGLGVFVAPQVGGMLTRAKINEFEFSALIIAALTFALLAERLGLHFALGAFIAGLFFDRRATNNQMFIAVKNRVSGITLGFLAPIFFGSIGMNLKLGALLGAPLFVALLIAVAIFGKLFGAGVAALTLGMSGRDAMSVGLGMSGRGAVELIVADIALRAGLFSVPTPPPPVIANLFSAVVIMAVATTLFTPVALRFWLRDEDRSTSPRSSAGKSQGGLLAVSR